MTAHAQDAPQTDAPNPTRTPAATPTPTGISPRPTDTPTATPNPRVGLTPQPVYALPPIWSLERLTSLEIAIPDTDAPSPVLDAIDAALPAVWTQVLVIQMDYADQAGGRYMQGLYSHTAPPVGGENVWPDNFLAAPSDFPASWLDTAILPYSPSPYRYWMDTYNGPHGAGFTFCVEIQLEAPICEVLQTTAAKILAGA
jgi:hypothetical protein